MVTAFHFSTFLHSIYLGEALTEAECINAFPTKKSGGLPFGLPLQKRCRRNELPDLYYDIKTPAGRNGFKGRLLLTGYFTHFTPPQPGMHFYLSPAVSRRGQTEKYYDWGIQVNSMYLRGIRCRKPSTDSGSNRAGGCAIHSPHRNRGVRGG